MIRRIVALPLLLLTSLVFAAEKPTPPTFDKGGCMEQVESGYVPSYKHCPSAFSLAGTAFVVPAQDGQGLEIGASVGPARTLPSGWRQSLQLLIVHNEKGDGGVVSSKSGHHVYPYPGPQSGERVGLLFSWTKD